MRAKLSFKAFRSGALIVPLLVAGVDRVLAAGLSPKFRWGAGVEVVWAVWFAGGVGAFTATAFFEHAAVNNSTAEAESIRAPERPEKLRYRIPLNFRPFASRRNPPNAVFRA
jgi:hypothetical protein